MARINSATPIAAVVGGTLPIFSFGYSYTAEVLEVKERTALVRYTNKGGKEWTLRVKRNDVAAPTAEQRAATERGATTRALRGNVRWRASSLEHAESVAAETREEINAKRAETRRKHIEYGWKLESWTEPLTEEGYAAERAVRLEQVARCAAALAEAQAQLNAHEALFKGK